MIAQLGQLRAQLESSREPATARYKDTPRGDCRAIARETRCGYLLEGSVQPRGDRVRVTRSSFRQGNKRIMGETYEPRYGCLEHSERNRREDYALLPSKLPAAQPASRRLSSQCGTSYDTVLLGLHELGEDTRESGKSRDRTFKKP